MKKTMPLVVKIFCAPGSEKRKTRAEVNAEGVKWRRRIFIRIRRGSDVNGKILGCNGQEGKPAHDLIPRLGGACVNTRIWTGPHCSERRVRRGTVNA